MGGEAERKRWRDRYCTGEMERLFSGNVTSFIHSRGSSCFYFRFQKEIEACWYTGTGHRNWDRKPIEKH